MSNQNSVMEPREMWIWLPAEAYAAHQTTRHTALRIPRIVNGQQDGEEAIPGNYTVARFARSYDFSRAIRSVTIRVSADTAFRLLCGGRYAARGPASPGGDFLFNERPREQHYASRLTLDASEHPEFADGRLSFEATVRMQPVRTFEFSRGHGGFFLDGEVLFADGGRTPIGTGDGWTAQFCGAWRAPGVFDGTIPDDKPVPAAPVVNRWHTLTAPIPGCTETLRSPEGGSMRIPAGKSISASLPLDRIYAGYLAVRAIGSTRLHVTIRCSETGEAGSKEEFLFCGTQTVVGLDLHSAGLLAVEAKNEGEGTAELHVGFLDSAYPVTCEAATTTSDEELNQVLRVCAHTLRCCRQTIHLDSARHCEPLACTGDYYIESLMTAFTFGDMRLAAFDVRRTAQLLRYHDGRMFHTTYSLIWTLMLWDVYRFSGEKALLEDCADALRILLARFTTYRGETGLLETPPDYMFVDWLVPDGISLHHPPKALGQTCLNLFWYGALCTAEKIFSVLGEARDARDAAQTAESAKAAITAHLWNAERGLFFEGLNTPTPTHLLGRWMPQNVEKRYYRRHANILAAYFGILPAADCRALLRRIFADDSLGEVQPYFRHFWLEAVYRAGLREEETLALLEAWKAPVRDCPKGLAEGFYPPEPNYRFDHSHAWGGTPAYALPLALSGLEILEPGMRTVSLSPTPLGLDAAEVEIPTPCGMIRLSLRKGESPRVTHPDGVRVTLR